MDGNQLTPSRGQRTRQRIIESAAAVFNQRGYSGTALSDLMQTTGLKKGGIYRHFANKEELAAAAFKFAWARAMAPRLEGLADSASGRERLSHMVANFVRSAPGGLRGGCPLMNTAVDADDTNSLLLGLARQALDEWRGAIESVVRKAQKLREIRTGITPATVAETLIGSLEGALLICRIEGNRRALSAAQKRLDAYILELAPASSAGGRAGGRLPPGKAAAADTKATR